MKILVVGSVRDNPEKASEIQEVAGELGTELANRGHTVLVGTDDSEDVDPSVVEGALSAEDKRSSVEVHVPRGMPEPYASRSEPRLKVVWHQFPDWDVTNMEVVRGVDGVLAIAGRVGVVQAGVAGWMFGVPVIPIECFGGGAKKLWQYGSSRRQEFYHRALLDREIDQLAAPWGRALNAKVVVEALETVARAAKLAKTPRRILYSVLAIMILALAAWVFFLTFPFVTAPRISPELWDGADSIPILFATVSAAGLLGAAMQTLRMIRQGEVVSGFVIVVDTGLGVAAGIVTGMLYLLAQVGVTGTVNPYLAEEDYARIALIVSMASLFASLYLDAALARFDKIKGSVLAGKHGQDDTD